MNGYLIFIVCLLVFEYALSLVVELLNLKHVRTDIPKEFEGWYDAEKYRKSQEYLKDSTRFDLVSSSIMTPLILAFILLGGFSWMDGVARAAGQGMIVTGLIFAGILIVGYQLVNLPFSIYSTYVIEEKYGFNKTKPGTFIADLFKGLALTLLLGGAVFAGILWFFSRAGGLAWLYSWAALTVFQLFMLYIAPVVILPLFNKFIPLEDGELRENIEGYAREQGFSLKGIFKIDGSRRSTKSNAYFTGFGNNRRIALYDTLIEKHTVPELVSVLAHEVGHYRLRHILKGIIVSILSTGLMFYILSFFIAPIRGGLYDAFQVETTGIGGYEPIYAGLIFFGFLYTPISMLLSIFQNVVSRRHEFQADAFAARTAGQPDAMIDALKKLTVDNLSNLAPHPLMVFLQYSHPPVLQRIGALRG